MTEPLRPSVSYNESIAVTGNATSKCSSGLMIERPIPDWRRKQARLDWLHSQHFDGVTAEPAQQTAATVHTSGIVGRTFREGIGLGAHASVDCAGIRLRESPLPWWRVRQILLNWLRRHLARCVKRRSPL